MLASAIGESLPMAIGVALSPLPIAAVIMIMLSADARTNAPVFLIGWLAGTITVALIVFTLPSMETQTGGPTALSGYIRIGLGAVLTGLGIGQWRKRPASGAKVSTPKFLASIDQMGVLKSLTTGFLLAAVHPKNTALTMAGAATIDASFLGATSQFIALLVYTAVAGSSVAVPVAGYFFFRPRVEPLLGKWKEWLIRNNTMILAVLLFVFGILLIAGGIEIATQQSV